MAIRKGVLTAAKFTTDYDGIPANIGTATLVDIPVLKIINRDNAPYTEESVTEQGVNDLALGAGVKGNAAFRVVIDDENETWATTLRAAANGLTPVWLHLTYAGTDPIIAGGTTGGIVNMSSSPGATFGQFGTHMVAFQCSAAGAGDTYDVLSS